MAAKGKIKKEMHFINREISWLSFNERVLQEAQDQSVPLIERMRFLGIFSNNLDEFFKVRVATLQRATGISRKPIDPMDFDPEATLRQIHRHVVKLQSNFDRTFKQVVRELEAKDIQFVNDSELSVSQRRWVDDYFDRSVKGHLVPLLLSQKAELPPLKDNAVYLAISLLPERGKETTPVYALLEIPGHLPRFVEIPGGGKTRTVLFQDDVIRCGMDRLFTVFQFGQAKAFALKFTRDAELDLDSDLSQSLIEKMELSLEKRKKGSYVRIGYDKDIPQEFLEFILRKTKIRDKENVIPGGRYHNKRDLMRFPDFGREDLCFPPMEPLRLPALEVKGGILDQIKKHDVLLHFPYHRFEYITDMVREAAMDPAVRTIRISIYRVSKDSQLVNALVAAARNGKRVIVVVELQARFDEENNLMLVEQLQEAGAKVIPGVQGLKVHSKLILISRREGNRSVRYAHIGSGNFHERTARQYSDTSLLTANRDIGREVRKLFEFFESNFQRTVFRQLIVSPFGTRRKFIELIQGEIKNAKRGRPAWIILKMNNLVDAAMIRKLYEASRAGVHIQLLVRGICSLVPGVKGMSDNIEVTSILGRFLEHTRIYCFCNNKRPLYYLSSADWMTRNLDYRIEVSTPVTNKNLQKELHDYLEVQLQPNTKARRVDRALSNRYVDVKGSAKGIDPQTAIYEYFRKRK